MTSLTMHGKQRSALLDVADGYERMAAEARKLAAKKEDKRKQSNRAAQEEGDADTDEGNDQGQDERPGSAKRFEPDADEGRGVPALDDDNVPAPRTTKKSPGGSSVTPGRRYEPEPQDEQQQDYEDEQEAVHDRSKKSSQRGTPVQSPGSDKSAIGPMGDRSSVVGKLAAPYVNRQQLNNAGVRGEMAAFASGLVKDMAVNAAAPELQGRPRQSR